MRFSYLFGFVMMIGLVGAVSICVDLDAPSAPSDLEVSGDVGSILLEWGEAVDSPDCSGIDYYVVYRDEDELSVVDSRDSEGRWSFVDVADLGEGSYSYYVYAVDMVGKNAGASVVNVVEVDDKGSSSGGKRTSSRVCDVDWECTTWGDCVDGERMRVCGDLNNCRTSYLKPVEVEDCDDGMSIAEVVEPAEVVEDEGFFSAMTGAVVGVAGSTGGIVTGAFVLIMLFGFVAVRIKRKNSWE